MTFVLKNDKRESANKTIRFPCSMIDEIETHLREDGVDVSFSSFVVQAVAYVLEDMAKSKDRFTAVSQPEPDRRPKAGKDK